MYRYPNTHQSLIWNFVCFFVVVQVSFFPLFIYLSIYLLFPPPHQNNQNANTIPILLQCVRDTSNPRKRLLVFSCSFFSATPHFQEELYFSAFGLAGRACSFFLSDTFILVHLFVFLFISFCLAISSLPGAQRCDQQCIILNKTKLNKQNKKNNNKRRRQRLSFCMDI